MTSNSRPRPLIIVGAPRSGTNALRDALCRLDVFHTWPCDELNPLWRTGNRDKPTDELGVEDARPEVAARIQKAFAKRATKDPAATLVEKTCANSLRLDFVNAVIPDAHYVEIVRDGRDAASSAMERWGASFELGYTLRKLRFVPPADLAGVVLRQLSHRVRRAGAPQSASVRTWGPRPVGLDQMIAAGASLGEICAAQWVACTRASDEFFASHSGSVLRIRYEDFVASPATTLQHIAEICGRQVANSEARDAAAGIHGQSVGRWQQSEFSQDHAAMARLAPSLRMLQYQ